MKERAERIAAHAVKDLLEMLENRQDNITAALSLMEETHDRHELADDSNYGALIAAGIQLEGVRESMTYWLTRSNRNAGHRRDIWTARLQENKD